MSVHSQIQARIQAFAVELEALVRQAALDAVSASLGGDVVSRSVPHRAPPREPRPLASAAKPVSSAAHDALSFKRKKGAKRTSEQLAKIDAAIVGFVKAHAGLGVEHMAKALGVPSSDLKPRVALLIGGKKLKKSGVKRATKYFAN